MRLLVIYNTETGDIVTTTTVPDETATYNGGLFVDVPENKRLVKIDPTNQEPIFDEFIDPLQEIRDTIDAILTDIIPSIMG